MMVQCLGDQLGAGKWKDLVNSLYLDVNTSAAASQMLIQLLIHDPSDLQSEATKTSVFMTHKLSLKHPSTVNEHII